MIPFKLEVPEADLQAKRDARQARLQAEEQQRGYAFSGGGGIFATIPEEGENQVLYTDDSYVLSRNTLERAPTVTACVNTISKLFRSLKLELRPERKTQSMIERLFNERPNDYQSAGAFWAEIASELVYNGECLIRVTWGFDGPERLWVWPADEVTVECEDFDLKSPNLTPIKYQFRKYSFIFNPDRPQVMHLRLHTNSEYSIRGRSPFWGMTSEVLANIYVSVYRREFMRQGGPPRLSISIPRVAGHPDPDPKLIGQLTKAFTKAVKSNASLRSTPALPAKVEDLGPKGNDLMNLTRYCDERLTSAVGLPLIAVNNLEKGTYSNTRQQNAVMVRNAIGPLVNELETCITRDLLIPMRQKRYRALIDTETLIKDEAAILNKLVLDRLKAGVITNEEAREQLGYDAEMPPTDDQDQPVEGQEPETGAEVEDTDESV